ncbi:isopenicillin N synthase family dioxygenase [Marinobacter segnicrescens]|uniref:isopenicillin N synthase family dioxygenase n=1 Tax=Marinobacter segnicrescens TaxID=430453 RepID=UPI003A9010A0
MSAASPETTAHIAFQSLPVIDVSGLRSGDARQRQKSADALGKAARDAGFLYVTGHGISSELIDRFRKRVREYFQQSHDEKMRDYIGYSANHSGYVPEGEEQFYGAKAPDRKEAYDVNFDMLEPEHARPMLGPNQWPELDGFKTDVKAYYDEVFQLGNLLFRGFALALELPEDSFTRHVNRPPSQLRLIHYPYNPDVPTDRPGIGAHTDYECFTILKPTAPGLEVMNGAGEWIDVPVLEDAFVINIGDMMEILSNGLYVATSHRVRKVAEERYSFPMFCNLDYDVRIEPLPQLISKERPARYEPQVCGEHLFAQTAQTFQYLKKRLERGELELPKGSKGLSSFGREAGGQR